MPQFNIDKINSLISELRRVQKRLELIGSKGKEEFLNDPDKIDSAKYNFIVGIESAIDICNHIISQNGYRAPKDYGDSFQVLFEQGAFDKEFLENLRAMAKFRNRLVHIYWDIVDEQIYNFIYNDVKDFKIFLDQIAVFLSLV
ncbi:MAG TPA: DUF86 domain-containing protein [Ignavibacteriaceae bacterium]|nr:DUF86 domain-containing protein [Ignavibacteriaceae bacterium]